MFSRNPGHQLTKVCIGNGGRGRRNHEVYAWDLLHDGPQVPLLDTGANFYNASGPETEEHGKAVSIRCDGRA